MNLPCFDGEVHLPNRTELFNVHCRFDNVNFVSGKLRTVNKSQYFVEIFRLIVPVATASENCTKIESFMTKLSLKEKWRLIFLNTVYSIVYNIVKNHIQS